MGYIDRNILSRFAQTVSSLFVKKETGKGLSSTDFTVEFNSKLTGIESGAQVNKIETIKVNGTTQTISNKAVNLEIENEVVEAVGWNDQTLVDLDLLTWGNISGTLSDQTDLNTILDNMTPVYETITLTSSNWTLDSVSGLYEYTITDNTVTTNTLIEANMDLTNQAKLKDCSVSSSSGSYTFTTSEAPTENITMTVIKQELRGASV